MHNRLLALLLAAPLLAASLTRQDPQDKPKPQAEPVPAVGAAAPAFRLNDHTGRAVAVGGRADDWTVVAFYPKAATSGCTREVCSLRDAASPFEDLGVTVYGISLDDVVSQKAFHDAQELNFALLSDPDGSVAKKFGVLPPGGRFTKRVTFVIDDQGVLRRIDDQVDVASHGADLAEWIRAAKGG